MFCGFVLCAGVASVLYSLCVLLFGLFCRLVGVDLLFCWLGFGVLLFGWVLDCFVFFVVVVLVCFFLGCCVLRVFCLWVLLCGFCFCFCLFVYFVWFGGGFGGACGG